MKLLKGKKNGVSSSKDKRISKASQAAIDDHMDTEITYWAGDSFNSLASSVTSPPSMTASFYQKALTGFDDIDDGPSVTGGASLAGSDAISCDGSKGSKGSSRSKTKKNKKDKKLRLRGKKKKVLKENALKGETVLEESLVESEENASSNGSAVDVVVVVDEVETSPKGFFKTRRRSSMGGPPPPPPPEDDEEPEKRSKPKRRNSLFGGADAHEPIVEPVEQEAPRRRQRRHSMFGSIAKSSEDTGRDMSPARSPKTSSGKGQPRRRRRSIFGGSSTDGGDSGSLAGSSVASGRLPRDIHKVVQNERLARGMDSFQRNMLLDALAQSLANDMACGRPSGGCDYHGNVGQGVSLQSIHNTLMENRSGPARKNILSTKFTEFGMAVVVGDDGTLYMCQLFR